MFCKTNWISHWTFKHDDDDLNNFGQIQSLINSLTIHCVDIDQMDDIYEVE